MTGSRVRWIAARRVTPDVSASRTHRAGRVAEPERRQAGLGRFERQRGVGGAQLGGGIEQRPVEQPLVDAADLA